MACTACGPVLHNGLMPTCARQGPPPPRCKDAHAVRWRCTAQNVARWVVHVHVCCRDISAATSVYFKDPSNPTSADVASPKEAKARSKARVFRLGDYQMKQLRNGAWRAESL